VAHLLVVSGSLLMILGAGAISTAKATQAEEASWKAAMYRECARYGMDAGRVASSLKGEDPLAREKSGRRWWELAIAAGAVTLFVWFAAGARHQAVAVNFWWMAVMALTLVCLVVSGWLLWTRTRFS